MSRPKLCAVSAPVTVTFLGEGLLEDLAEIELPLDQVQALLISIRKQIEDQPQEVRDDLCIATTLLDVAEELVCPRHALARLRRSVMETIAPAPRTKEAS